MPTPLRLPGRGHARPASLAARCQGGARGLQQVRTLALMCSGQRVPSLRVFMQEPVGEGLLGRVCRRDVQRPGEQTFGQGRLSMPCP